MPVIALTQGMGSLSQEVADQLAQELKIATLQTEVAQHVADKMHVSKSLISRVRTGHAGTIERFKTDHTSIAIYTAEDVLDTAARGNVVLRGWGASALLRPVPHVPCIRIMRPFAKRVQWLMAELDTDDIDLAEAEIRRSDHANTVRMNQQFGVDWGDPVLYDMVLNTDRLSVDTCVAQIKALVARPEFAQTEASQALLEGMALSAHVRAALRGNEQTHNVDITIEGAAGTVTLSGIVVHAPERAAAEAVAATVPGVKAVDNQLRVMAKSRLFPTARE